MAKTHPHITSPTETQLREIVADRSEPIVETYLEFHNVVLSALPEIANEVDTVDAAIGYGARQYGYSGWGMAAVMPYSKWVSLTLMQGARLDVTSDLLTGSSTMRHVKLSKPEDIAKRRDEITRLLVAASQLHANG